MRPKSGRIRVSSAIFSAIFTATAQFLSIHVYHFTLLGQSFFAEKTALINWMQ